jgi:hypothetical protein
MAERTIRTPDQGQERGGRTRARSHASDGRSPTGSCSVAFLEIPERLSSAISMFPWAREQREDHRADRNGHGAENDRHHRQIKQRKYVDRGGHLNSGPAPASRSYRPHDAKLLQSHELGGRQCDELANMEKRDPTRWCSSA